MDTKQNSFDVTKEASARTAEFLLTRATWMPIEMENPCEGELAYGESPGGLYTISVWADEDGSCSRFPLCTVGESPAQPGVPTLSVLGVPFPEHVPVLLERYADRLFEMPDKGNAINLSAKFKGM